MYRTSGFLLQWAGSIWPSSGGVCSPRQRLSTPWLPRQPMSSLLRAGSSQPRCRIPGVQLGLEEKPRVPLKRETWEGLTLPWTGDGWGDQWAELGLTWGHRTPFSRCSSGHNSRALSLPDLCRWPASIASFWPSMLLTDRSWDCHWKGTWKIDSKWWTPGFLED